MNILRGPQPHITVIIPARNAATTIEAALRSLVPDRHLIGEVVLVDDGSNDRTAALSVKSARKYDLPLTIVAVRLGSAGAARNAGIARATGNFIFFLDADDEVIEGGLSLLHDALLQEPEAGLSIGASIRRTPGRPDKLKPPHGYTRDKAANARRYLLNETWPIAMGSALVTAHAAAAIRFPEATSLDEDTCYWAALLARFDVATVPAPVLLYQHDEARMARRFVRAPRATFLAIALELNRLALPGVEKAVRQWRKSWIALRISRQLIKHGMYTDAAGMMRAVRAHAAFGRSWRALRYRARIRVGGMIRQSARAAMPSPGEGRRTLVVSYDPAYPPVSGADLRNYRNAELAAEYGPVCLVSVLPPSDSSTPADPLIRTKALTIKGEARSASIGWRRVPGENRISRSALKRLKALIDAFHPDTIVVEGVPLFKLLKPLRPLASQLILDMHNVESDLAGQLQRNPQWELSMLTVAPGLLRLERKALSIVDRVWVCSSTDREKLNALAPHQVPIDVVPNGIPRPEAIPTALPAEPTTAGDFPVILFVGHLGYAPNIDAALRLATAILPRIRETSPGAKLVIAGRSPTPKVVALADLPGVTLVEDPAELAPLLTSAHLTIVPLSSGGGTRIKLLEAMAWGVPVVATPLAAEGLDLIDGEEVLFSDSDEGLAKAAIALCQDRERLMQQRMRAHKAVWARFGPEAIRNAVRRGLGLDDGPR